MFTGIIEEVGEVVDAGGGMLRICARSIVSGTKPGESIAINGVDLTVVELEDETFAATIMPETYRRTNLAHLEPGKPVNLERSLRPTDRLSGHIVRGVVEGVATVESVVPEADAIIVKFRAAPDLLRYIVVKGPVAVDGVSLTTIDKTDDSFVVSLVEYTQAHTTLASLEPGDSVNIETDILARYIEALLRGSSEGSQFDA
jgi:riboflavin synthase